MQVRVGQCKACDLVYDVETDAIGEDSDAEVARRKAAFKAEHGDHQPARLLYLGKTGAMAMGEKLIEGKPVPKFLEEGQLVEVPTAHAELLIKKWPGQFTDAPAPEPEPLDPLELIGADAEEEKV